MRNYLFQHKEKIIHIGHIVVLVLSVMLIVYISFNTFNHVSILDNHIYMTFQLWVCVIFMAEFFMSTYLSTNRTRYFFRHILFLLISIPYLNIINQLNLTIDAHELYFLRFIPLLRGALALAIIIAAVSKNRITTIFFVYISIMVLVVYFSSLIFYEREHPVNSQISNYWLSLWWCCLETTTIGAPINPVTVVGKMLAALLSCMGMLMFPLFTVYLSNVIKRHVASVKGTDKTTASANVAESGPA